MIKSLTSAQQKVLNFYERYITENGHAPSYSEASRTLGLTPGAIHYHIKNLETLGCLVKSSRKQGVQLYGEYTQAIPILGKIAGGKPISLFEECDDYLEIPKSMIKGSGSFYALKVVGESMKNAGILDGDTIIIRQQADVTDGEIAVVAIEDGAFETATLKRVFHKPGALLLNPENEDFEPFLVREGSIRGKMIGTIREYEDK